MTPEEIRHKLSELIDGAVTSGEKSAMEQHLKTCTECSDALAELRKTIEHIHSIEEVESPAWMTQKIMAKVRTEAENKKGIWQRVFAPFFMKFPVQAVAVLFLAVTAYYIYSSINPAQKYTEEPVGMSAKKEAPAVGRMKEEDKTVREAAPEAKQDSGKPGYKSLDMKYAYEKPAAPVRQEQPAASTPAPAKRDAFMSVTDEADVEKRLMSPKTAAPSLMAEQAAKPSVRAPAGLSSGVSKDTEPKKESFSAVDKAKSTFRAKSYLEFIRTIERFPYEAPRSKKDLIVNNYEKLMTGMTQEEIASIIGEPDYSTSAQTLDPPYRQQGTYWTFDLYIKSPELVSLDTDQFLNIFFDIHEKAYSFSPHNIPGLAQKGEKLDTSK
jgi:anti-sigma factor RsiW